VKRQKPDPLVDDVALCLEMGWTWNTLQNQPTRFIERLTTYLGALADQQSREQMRLEEQLRRLNKR
jgi:hypothetical protein